MTRGTMQTEFVHKPYAELRRLGLTSATPKARARRVSRTRRSCWSSSRCIPGSPRPGQLRPGDILIEVNGKLVDPFVPARDGARRQRRQDGLGRGGAVRRAGRAHASGRGSARHHSRRVHRIRRRRVPQALVSASAAFLSSVEGVYVANPGYVFGKAAIPRGSIVTAIGSERSRISTTCSA